MSTEITKKEKDDTNKKHKTIEEKKWKMNKKLSQSL